MSNIKGRHFIKYLMILNESQIPQRAAGSDSFVLRMGRYGGVSYTKPPSFANADLGMHGLAVMCRELKLDKAAFLKFCETNAPYVHTPEVETVKTKIVAPALPTAKKGATIHKPANKSKKTMIASPELKKKIGAKSRGK
jgi:hypothetical protein